MSNEWKQKYLNKLDQVEKSEKEWQRFEEFLRQTISRLALAAEGGSKLLDSKLVVLRKAIRQGEGIAKLTRIMDEISTELVRLDKLKANQVPGNAGFLLRVVDALSTTADMDKKAKKLKKQLNAKNPPEDSEIIQEFSDYFKECLVIAKQMGEEEAQSGEPKQGGFFSNLFGAKKAVEEASPSAAKSMADDQAEATKVVMVDESEPGPEKIYIEEENSSQLPAQSAKEAAPASTTQEQTNSIAATELLPEENRQAIEKSLNESLQNILGSFIDSLDFPESNKQSLREKLTRIDPSKEFHVLLDDFAKVMRKPSSEELASDNEGAETQNDKADGSSIQISQTQPHEILIRLLEFLPLEDKFYEQAQDLKKDFAKGISQEELPAALEAIAQLISAMQRETQEDQKQFESFLMQLTGRLKEVDDFLGSDLNEHKISWQNGVNLDNAVKEHVKGIGESVSEATDLKDLETTVQGRLDKILRHVEEHRQSENKRVKRIQQQNQSLKDKIQSLENETQELKASVMASQEKAYIDALTKLPNRMAYDRRIDEEYERWKRYHENLLLMVWDIDFFKGVNDTYGHKAGDKVLKVVGNLLRDNLRKTDFIARYGGEEFVSLLPETSLGGGFKIAEKMRLAVQELDFHYREEKVQLTISCGISLFAEGDDPDKVFERADGALYQAKKQGRNRCVIAQD